MNTTPQNTVENEVSMNLCRALAYAEFNDLPYFILPDGRAFQGDYSECVKTFEEDGLQTWESFSDYCDSELTEIEEQDESFEFDDKYIVLTDDEASEKCKDYILDSVWAFNPSFLSGETGIHEDVFRAIQDNGKCESNNDAILSCIDDEDAFVEAAIAADGRGHFMNTYDGEETEVVFSTLGNEYEENVFYVYRIN